MNFQFAIRISFFTISLVFFACRREKIEKNHKEFIGDWTHHLNDTEDQYLRINTDGGGYVKVYKDGKIEQEHSRHWYIKDNYLLFGPISRKKGTGGKGAFSYKITQPPSVATYSFTSNYDTVLVGDTYIILDNNVYK